MQIVISLHRSTIKHPLRGSHLISENIGFQRLIFPSSPGKLLQITYSDQTTRKYEIPAYIREQ